MAAAKAGSCASVAASEASASACAEGEEERLAPAIVHVAREGLQRRAPHGRVAQGGQAAAHVAQGLVLGAGLAHDGAQEAQEAAQLLDRPAHLVDARPERAFAREGRERPLGLLAGHAARGLLHGGVVRAGRRRPWHGPFFAGTRNSAPDPLVS
jgi:hypothetical protein